MKIQLIGSESGCDSCAQAEENLKTALKELGIDAGVEKVTDLLEIVKLGVMQAPAVIADGKLLFAGQVPTVKQLVKALKKVM